MVCFGLIGSTAIAINLIKSNGGVDAKGPRLKAKSKSLKLASQPRWKKVASVRWTEESGTGRRKKVVMTGRKVSNLPLTLEIRLEMKKHKERHKMAKDHNLIKVLSSLKSSISRMYLGGKLTTDIARWFKYTF